MKQNTNTINVTCSYSNHLQSVSLLTRLLLWFVSLQMSMLRYTGSCLQCWNCKQPCMSCWYRYSNASSTNRSHRKQTRRTCLWKRIVFYLQRFSLELQYKQFIDRLSTDGEFIQSSRRSAGGCVCLYVCMQQQSVWQLWQRGKSLDVCAASSSSSSRPPLASTAQWLSPFFPTTYTATKWNHHLWVRHNNKPEHKETRLLWLVRTLLKSFMLVACTGVPINVR